MKLSKMDKYGKKLASMTKVKKSHVRGLWNIGQGIGNAYHKYNLTHGSKKSRRDYYLELQTAKQSREDTKAVLAQVGDMIEHYNKESMICRVFGFPVYYEYYRRFVWPTVKDLPEEVPPPEPNVNWSMVQDYWEMQGRF